MEAAYNAARRDGEHVFAAVDAQYESLKQKVTVGDWLGLSHAELERE